MRSRNDLLSIVLVATVLLVGGTAMAGAPQIHGMVSQGYLSSGTYDYLAMSEQGTFGYTEVALNFAANVAPKLRIGAQLYSRNLGSAGNNNVVLDWAYGDYRFRDALGFRIGKVKLVGGLYNKTRDVDMVRNSMFLPQSVYAENLRDITNSIAGAGIYGNFSLGSSSSIEYELQAGDLELDSSEWLYRQVADAGYPITDFRTQTDPLYAGSLRWNTPLEGLALNGTYRTTKLFLSTQSFLGAAPPTMDPMHLVSDVDYQVDYQWVASLEWLWNDLTLVGEYTRGKNTQQISVTQPGAPEPMAMPEMSTETGGYYVQAAYRFSPLFEFGAIYDVFHPDWTDKSGDELAEAGGVAHRNFQKDFGLTARFDINDWWLIKVEGHVVKGTALLSSYYNPEFPEENWNWFGAKSTFSF